MKSVERLKMISVELRSILEMFLMCGGFKVPRFKESSILVGWVKKWVV